MIEFWFIFFFRSCDCFEVRVFFCSLRSKSKFKSKFESFIIQNLNQIKILILSNNL